MSMIITPPQYPSELFKEQLSPNSKTNKIPSRHDAKSGQIGNTVITNGTITKYSMHAYAPAKAPLNQSHKLSKRRSSRETALPHGIDENGYETFTYQGNIYKVKYFTQDKFTVYHKKFKDPQNASAGHILVPCKRDFSDDEEDTSEDQNKVDIAKDENPSFGFSLPEGSEVEISESENSAVEFSEVEISEGEEAAENKQDETKLRHKRNSHSHLPKQQSQSSFLQAQAIRDSNLQEMHKKAKKISKRRCCNCIVKTALIACTVLGAL